MVAYPERDAGCVHGTGSADLACRTTDGEVGLRAGVRLDGGLRDEGLVNDAIPRTPRLSGFFHPVHRDLPAYPVGSVCLLNVEGVDWDSMFVRSKVRGLS